MEGGFVRGSHDKEVATIDLILGFYAPANIILG